MHLRKSYSSLLLYPYNMINYYHFSLTVSTCQSSANNVGLTPSLWKFSQMVGNLMHQWKLFFQLRKRAMTKNISDVWKKEKHEKWKRMRTKKSPSSTRKETIKRIKTSALDPQILITGAVFIVDGAYGNFRCWDSWIQCSDYVNRIRMHWPWY